MTMDHIKPTKRKPNIHELAAMAMQGLISGDTGAYFRPREAEINIAESAYCIAEAMIKEGEEYD